MRPFVANNEAWRVVRVPPGDPALVDRTGRRAVATTDPAGRVVRISSDVAPPLLDRVLVHEVAHALTVSHGLLDGLRASLPEEYWVPVEEWAVQLVEGHGIEAAELASQSLGRPVCVRGWCHGRRPQANERT